jgi:hypothetical protein
MTVPQTAPRPESLGSNGQTLIQLPLFVSGTSPSRGRGGVPAVIISSQLLADTWIG